uniref:Centromere protein F n=1 Tax=Gadus morhua TaxID=8049 RepID=A0A8C4ZIH5_GADMO
MSWAVEEWKDGLPAKALQKILEIEGQLDKLKKERTQKQFQLDSLEAALQKQKQKVDSERSDASHLKRENQTLLESCDSLEKSRQKVVHDLGIKEQQVSYLDGQLSASKRTIERLEQELKKYKNESDRSSSSSSSLSSSSCSELQAYATPLKSFPAPSATPGHRQQDNRLEELQGKYSQEVDERKRLETELKVLQVKMLNQSSTTVSHKDIAARQQAGSSIFPWQKSDQPQSRPSQVPLDTPIKRCGGGGSSLWDAHDETPIKPSQRMSSSAVAQSPAGSSDQMKQLKALNQELRGCMSELERNLASQEKEIRGQSSRLQELQIQLDQSRRELVDRDRDLAKTRHELTQASAKHQQSEDKCSSLELKLKQVTEEMGCQRHNAETCKRALEQKIKDQERTNQKELAQLQSSQHALEQTLNQTKSKLTQEIQQAKKDHNMLEAEMEKVGHQKSQMQRDVEEHRQKLLRSEQGLQTSQSKEQDLRKKMEELLKEKNSVSVQLDQGSRRLSQLEEEKKSSEQSFKRTQGLLDDMKAKWEAQTEEVKGLKCKLEQQTQSSSKELDNLRKALSDAEAKTNSSQSELQKQKRETEQLSDRLAVLEKEGQALGASLASSQRECTEQRLEHQALLAWKAEKEALIDQTEAVQGVLRENISRLESAISQLNKDHDELKGQLNGVEAQRAGLSAQIDSLKGELLNKSTELEVRERQYEDAQAQLSEAGQKHAKDLDNIGVQVALLQEQVGALEARLQQEAGRADRAEVSRAQLQEQHQTTCDLLLSKEQMLELGQAETSQLRDSLALASEQQDAQNHRLMEEKLSMQSQCEETVAEKAEEAEQAKLELIKIQQDLMLSEDKISSLQSALKIQKSLGAGLQGQIDTLSAAEEEQKQALNATSEALNQTRQEVKALQSQAEDKEKLLLDAEHKITALEEQTAALETKAVELKAEAENLQHTHTEEGDGLRAQLTALSEEVTRSKALAEQLPALKAELEAAKKSCGSLQNALEAAQESHAPCADNAAGLERSLAKTAGLLGPLETQVRELSEGRARQEESHVREMEGFLHKQKALKEQLAASREAERAATEELAARREQVANMKRSLSAASAGLQEQDGAVKGLKERLNRAEAAHTKASDSLKEKTVAMDKIKVLMEMLQMDLEDTETARTSFDGQVEELKGTIALLERQKTDLEVRLEDSQAQVSVLETRLEEVQSSNATLESQYETAQEHLLEWSNRGPHTEEGVSDLLSDCYQQLEKSEILSKIVNKEKEMLVEDVSVLEARNEKLLTNSSILESRFQPMLRSNRVAHSFFNQEYGKLHVAYEQMVEETARLEAEIHGLHEERKISDRRATEDNFEMFIKLQYLTKAKVLAEAKVHQLIEEKAEAKLTEDEAEIPDLNKVSDENNELETSLNRLAEERLQLESAIRLLTGDKVQRQTSLDLLAEEKRQLHASMDPAQLMAPANDESRQHWDAVRRLAERIQETKKKSDCRDFRGRQFEPERELHEKTSGLQKELVLFKEQYAALLEKVDQQHRVIQQLSETQGSPGCMDTASPSHGDQQVVGHIQPASCQPDEMESSMEAPAERHSTMAAPDADQDEPPNRPVDTARRSFHHEQPCRGVAEARCPAAEDEGPKMNLPEPHQLQADLDQSRDKMRLLEEELQSLRSEVLLLTSDLSLRKELSSELQGKVDQLELMLRASEVQGGGTAGKLTLTLQESRGFEKQVFQLSEERDALTLQLQTAKEQLVDIMQMMEGMEMAKGGWDEKFLQQESELRRVRSEKANLEQHILGMESELEALQEHRGTLERVLETQRRACSGLELQVDTLRTESTQLRAELVSCTEERDEASRAVGRWRQEVHSLEKTNVDTRQLISILEEDIRVGRREYEALQSNAERLDGEKQQLRGQVGALEQELCEHRGQREELLSQLDRVTEDQNSACHNSESMASKIQALEADLSRMTQSLESSLLEKGEIASRLNSTQGEVQNMRSGIEKLQVRIESDERKKKKIGELLKDAQRKSDSLQDRIDALEREKEGTEQSLEEAVIQAEIAKAEIEELEDERKKVEEEKSSLGEKLSALAAELDHLRQEKEAMEGELEAKSRVIEELRAAKEELERGMERAETGRREEQERQRSVVEGMEREAESERAEALEKWSRERQALEASVSKLEEELRGLHSGLAEAEAEWARREQESDSRGSEERDALRGTISSLEGEASVLAEENQRASAKLSSLEEEKEKLISSLASLENEKESANAALALSQTEKSRLEEEKEALRSSLSSLEAERDRLTGEQQDLQATLSSLEAELETCRQSLSQATQQVSELSGQVGALAKGRDSALSKMNLWMKTCQQLQQEKETLEQSSGAGSSTEASAHGEEARLLAEQRQAAVTAELETTRKELEAVTAELETTRKELEEVTAELEERSREADESLDKYCSLMVQVHKLEEANETLSARLQRGTTPAPATATPAPAAATTPTPTKRLSRRLSKRQEVAPEVDAKNPTPSPVLPGSTARALSLGKRLHLANRDAAAHTPAKAQEALYNLTKRIKAGVATPQPGGPQDEEFRPEGLPELVQRGFADIPMGEASPFIMRRTTAKRRSSRLSSRRTPAAADRTVTQSPLADGKVSGHLSLTSPAVAAVTPAGSPAGRAGRRSLSLQKTPEQREKRREALREQAQQGENCQVQ